MEPITLKRGGRTIQLVKSEHLIALKAASDSGISMVLAMEPAKLQQVDTGVSLGGFRIVNINSPINKFEHTLDRMRLNNLVAEGSHVYHTPGSTVPIVPTGRITLRFSATATSEQQQEILDKHKLQIIDTRLRSNPDSSTTATYIVRTTLASLNPLKVAYSLQQEDIVLLADPDLATKAKLTEFRIPSDPLLKEQWHLRNTGEQFGTSIGLKVGADADVVSAWTRAQTLGSPSCIVAVIDDGFDVTHPDLSGNGKIHSPWDFTTNTIDPSPKHFHPNESHAEYHGTSCAGVAIGNANGAGIVGVAPDCSFMPIRWGEDLSDESIEKWFDYAAKCGAWIVSCSWKSSEENYVLSDSQREAIERCALEGRNGLGCVVVFAAGNENSDINDPQAGTVNGFAIHPNVIAVAACNSRDNRSDYSNFGKEVSVCAPSSGSGGRGILTSDVRGQYQYNGRTYDAGYEAGDFTKTFGGTSSATPLVAGVCALILSVSPTLTSTEVKRILEKTARRIGQQSDYTNGHSHLYGYGCVDADAALEEAMKNNGGIRRTSDDTFKVVNSKIETVDLS